MSTTVPTALGPYADPLLGPSWALFGLALILLLARAYTSKQMTHSVGLDLYLTILTFALGCTSLAFFTVAVCYGLGQHIGALSMDQQVVALKNSWRFTSVSLFAIAIAKLAVIAFLQRLHSPGMRTRAILLWTLGASNVVINAITVALALASCSPMAKLWNSSLPGNCNGVLRNEYCAYFQGSWNAMADLVLALYPITLLWTLQMSNILKFGLCFLMGLGTVACACAVVKTVKLANISKSDDFTYHIGQLNFWNIMEMWVIFIVACIPPIRKLLVAIAQKLRLTHPTTYKPTNGTYTHYTMELRSERTRKSRKSESVIEQEQDTGSEENILGTGSSGDIRKTTDIEVESWTTAQPIESFERHDPMKAVRLPIN